MDIFASLIIMILSGASFIRWIDPGDRDTDPFQITASAMKGVIYYGSVR